jgi:hypothetical protein
MPGRGFTNKIVTQGRLQDVKTRKKTLVREKCDDDEDRLERLARSSFDHLLPARDSFKAGPRVTILSRNLAAGSAFAMLVDVWRARPSNQQIAGTPLHYDVDRIIVAQVFTAILLRRDGSYEHFLNAFAHVTAVHGKDAGRGL